MASEQNKDDLLEEIYRKANGQVNGTLWLDELRLLHFENWDGNTFEHTVQALEHDGLITVQHHNRYVNLTVAGRRRAESSLNPPPTFTQNTFTANTVTNSPIQQGGAQTAMSQIVSYAQEDSDNLRRLVEVFENHIDDLGLDATTKRKATAQVATIRAQLEDEPNQVIVKEAGHTLRNLTEGVIGGLIASAAQPTVWAIVPSLWDKLFG